MLLLISLAMGKQLMIHTWMILKLEQPEKMLSEQRKRRVKGKREEKGGEV